MLELISISIAFNNTKSWVHIHLVCFIWR